MAYTLQIILEILLLIFLFDYFRRVNENLYDNNPLDKNIMTIVPTILCFIYLISTSRATKTDPYINMLAPLAVSLFIMPMFRGDAGLPFINSKLTGNILGTVFMAAFCLIINQIFYNSLHFKQYWAVYLCAFSLLAYCLRNTVFNVSAKPKYFRRVIILFIIYSFFFYDSTSSFADIKFANWTEGFSKLSH